MEIRGALRFFLLFFFGFFTNTSFARTVVFWQAGFPAADSPAPDEAGLRAGFADASFVDAAGLSAALGRSDTDLLVLPYGSAWPEAEWEAILEYLDRGGNLIVLGGKPFTRAAYEDAGWVASADGERGAVAGAVHSRLSGDAWGQFGRGEVSRRIRMCFRSCRRLGGSGRLVRWCG